MFYYCRYRVGLGLLIAAFCGTTAAATETRHPRHVLGATHVNGTYNLTNEPYLIEGANQVRSLGYRVIKLYMFAPPASNSVERAYPFFSQWPHMKTPTDVARTAYFRKVFAMPFETFILTVYSGGRREHYWLNGVSDEQMADETRQFQELASYLSTTYEGSGKTFVLSHWEGDWAARGSFDPQRDPTTTAMQGMIRWLNARQAGVDLARRSQTRSDVRVVHAAEVNRVRDAMEQDRECVANAVIPHTNVDLVSYSAWDTQHDPTLLRKALNFLARHAPDSAIFGSKNVYLGEFGKPENEFTREQVQGSVSKTFWAAYEWGCPYVVYWQLYCNEARSRPVLNQEDVRGFWLVRPDGSHGWACQTLQEILDANSR